MKTILQQVEATLLEFALSLPGAVEEFPWNERSLKVNKKIFLSLGFIQAEPPLLRLALKLQTSHEEAMALPFTTPSGYNLGKHGWVTIRFTPADDPPVPLLMDWIEESYRLIAPKRLIADLEKGGVK